MADCYCGNRYDDGWDQCNRECEHCEVCGGKSLNLVTRCGMEVCDDCAKKDRWTIPEECPAPYCECSPGECAQGFMNLQRWPINVQP